MLDDNDLKSLDHIGVALHRAAEAWTAEFRTEMAARGFNWHLGASGEVLAHLGPSGVSQTVLTERMGLSKQAVQQLVDRLEADGVIRREADPADKRAKRVVLTELGRKDFAERNKVKRQIEERYRDKLGKKLFGKLDKALRKLREPD